MLVKKLKDPFLVISLLLLVAALVTGGLLFQAVTDTLTGGERPGSNLHLAEDDKGFHYMLPSQATEFQAYLFEQLTLAKSESPDNQALIAGLVVQNFVADFFTWSNKTGRADVGGLQFVASQIRSQFRSAAIDDFYLYLNQYIQRYTHDRLIEVSGVTIEEVDLNYLLTLLTGTETDYYGIVHHIYEEVPVIRVQARWTYRGWFPDFQDEAVFYLTHEDGYLSIRAMVEIAEPEDEEVQLYGW